MLFIALFRVKDRTVQESMARRLQYQWPEGIEIEAEYWLERSDPEAIVVFRADDHASILQYSAAWNDLYDVIITPAVSAEEGMEIAKQMLE